MRPSAAGARARPAPPAALFKGAKAKAAPKPVKGKEVEEKRSWYQQTREDARPSRAAGWTTRDEIAFRKEANLKANNGVDRKDLYTDNWDGSEYKGSALNVGTVLAFIAVAAPLVGLWFAYTSYGILWG